MDQSDMNISESVVEESSVPPTAVNDNELDTLAQTFDDMLVQVEGFLKDMKTLSVELKNSKKKYLKIVKSLTKSKRRRSDDVSVAKKEPSGFISPIQLSPELCDFLSVPYETLLARTVVTKRIITYIKENSLESKSNGRNFDLSNVDDEKATVLRKLFKIENGDEVNYFNLKSYLKPHFIPLKKKALDEQIPENVEQDTDVKEEETEQDKQVQSFKKPRVKQARVKSESKP